MSIDKLVAKAAGGDKDAFCRLVERYQGLVRSHISRYVANLETVCDLAQDTFLEAYRALGRFDGDRDLGAWLSGIARNCALRHLRAESKRKSREQDLLSEAIARWRVRQIEEDVPSTHAYLDALRRCMEKVGEFARRLVHMRYSLGQGSDAIAADVRMNPRTVRQRLVRIRTALRECVNEQLEECDEPG